MIDPVSAISPASFQSFGDLLRYLRKRAELSQRELALHVGYHYSYMSRIENNEYIPDAAMLMARFVPALGLEKEPVWTRRLLELGTAGGKSPAGPSPEPVVDSRTTDHDLPPGSFPVSLTSLLGREQEVSALLRTLSRRDVRLVTLLGPPGVGKTRLAVQVASEAAGMFAHGLKFVDLAPVTEPGGFLSFLAQHLGVNEIAGVPLLARLAQALRQKNILLVLDNFEQIVEAAPQVYQLLSNSSQVKAMVTSRVALHIPGENQFSVQPLPVPRQTSLERQDALAFAAIQLFVERARAVQPEFELTPGNMDAVLEICRGLDGLPLAIELAAARARTLSPRLMLKEFEHRFDWLAPNYREEQSSKQTLRGAIEWSHGLLSEKEQILFRRLSVFSAGRTVETARAVCADPDADRGRSRLQRDEIFDLLIQLTDKSLLFSEAGHEEPRFNFLETIHEFAREKLEQAGEEAEFRNRHLAYFCQMAEQFELEIERENQTLWLDRVEIEQDNFRAALDWSLKEGADLQTGVRLAASLGLFWYLHSHFVEGLERSKIFLQKAREPGEERVLAKLLFRTADLHLHRAEFDSAVRLGEEAVALCRRIDDRPLLAWALYVLGDIYLALNDLTAAEQSLSESIDVCIEIGYAAVQDISLLLLSTILLRQGELARAHATVLKGLALAEQLSDPWGIAAGLGTLGEIRLQMKEYAEARVHFERSLEASRAVGDKFIVGGALVNLALLSNLQGQYEESDRYAEEALSIFQLVGDETRQPLPLRVMGYAAIQAGNLVRARVLLRESLIGSTRLESLEGQLGCLVGLAGCALAEQDVRSAVMFCALVDESRQEKSLRLADVDELAFEMISNQCREQLGTSRYAALYKEGQALKLEETMAGLTKE